MEGRIIVHNNEIPETDQAFVDIISNTLGILILITLLTIIISGQISNVDISNKKIGKDKLSVNEPIKPIFKKKTSVYVSLENNIVKLSLDEAGEFLIKHPNKTIYDASIGRMEFMDFADLGENKPRMHRDIDCYDFKIKIDKKKFDALPKTVIDQLFQQIKQDYGSEEFIPLFFVYSSGIEAFSQLHKRLMTHNIPYRWVPTRNTITLFRSHLGFTHYYSKI
jgi:hypothetical protein